MVKKNIVLKKAAKGGLIMDILFPGFIGFLFWSLANNFKNIVTSQTDQ